RRSSRPLKPKQTQATTTVCGGGPPPPADTAGIMLAYVHGELLFEANLKSPGTAFLLCGVVGISEAFCHIQPKICQQHLSRITFEPYAPSVTLHLEGKRPSTAPTQSHLNGLVQVDDGAVAAHQETSPNRGTRLPEHDA